MLVGMVNLNAGKSPRFARFRIWIRNFKDHIIDNKYKRRRTVLKCINCGALLIPLIQKYGAKDCDWHKTQRGWVCHTCYNPYAPSLCSGFDSEYMKDYLKHVQERNNILKKKISKYNKLHSRKKIIL